MKRCNSLSHLVAFLQGSVTTHLRCGGIFSDNIIENFLLILTVEQFRKSINIWSYGIQKIVPNSLATMYMRASINGYIA